MPDNFTIRNLKKSSGQFEKFLAYAEGGQIAQPAMPQVPDENSYIFEYQGVSYYYEVGEISTIPQNSDADVPYTIYFIVRTLPVDANAQNTLLEAFSQKMQELEGYVRYDDILFEQGVVGIPSSVAGCIDFMVIVAFKAPIIEAYDMVSRVYLDAGLNSDEGGFELAVEIPMFQPEDGISLYNYMQNNRIGLHNSAESSAEVCVLLEEEKGILKKTPASYLIVGATNLDFEHMELYDAPDVPIQYELFGYIGYEPTFIIKVSSDTQSVIESRFFIPSVSIESGGIPLIPSSGQSKNVVITLESVRFEFTSLKYTHQIEIAGQTYYYADLEAREQIEQLKDASSIGFTKVDAETLSATESFDTDESDEYFIMTTTK